MKKYILSGLATALFCTLLPLSGTSQVKVAPGANKNGTLNLNSVEPKAQLRIKSPMESYRNTITERDLRAHLSFLASDELEGRATGERGQKLAAKYLATQFQKMGLQPGIQGKQATYFQKFELERTQFMGGQISLTGKDTYAPVTDWVTVSAKSLPEKAELPFIFGGYGISDEAYNNYAGLSVKGKAVLVLTGEPKGKDGKSLITKSAEMSAWGSSWFKKYGAAVEAGAGAFILVLPNDQFDAISTSNFINHGMQDPSLGFPKEDKTPPCPYIIIPEKFANTILKSTKMSTDELRESMNSTDTPPSLDFKKREFRFAADVKREIVITENVLGVIPGTTHKDEYIFITAHYDHLGVKDGEIFNGADDDGSGVAAILELAEAFSQAAQNGFAPKRSIVFMPVTGEEKGLLGSKYYVEHPVFPLENTVCDLNIDMIGRIDDAHIDNRNPHYVYAIGSDMISQTLHDVSDEAAKKYGKIELDYTYNTKDDPNRYYYRSDHYNFAKNDIPVIFYFTGVHPDYHKSTDTIDKIMFPKMTKIARLIFSTAWEIANREESVRGNE